MFDKILTKISDSIRWLAFYSVKKDLCDLQPQPLKRLPALRLWKLGNSELKKYPSEFEIVYLVDRLKSWDKKEDLDIIWNDLISCQVIYGNPDDVDIIEDEQGKKIILKGDIYKEDNGKG
jgi:hypothetical protein